MRAHAEIACALFPSTGEFLTFSAMVLAILVNMGQISNNRVARAIYYTELDTTGFEDVIRSSANAGGVNVASVYASDQSSPVLAGNGLKDNVSGLWYVKMRFLLTPAFIHVHSTDGDSMVSCSNGMHVDDISLTSVTSSLARLLRW